MAEGTTAPQRILEARERAKADFQTFQAGAVERFIALAEGNRRDERVAYLLDHYGLRRYVDRRPAIPVGELYQSPFLIGFGFLLSEFPGSDSRVPADQRDLALSYVQRFSGEVDVELVEKQRPFAQVRPNAIRLATVPAAALLDDQVLANHWTVLQRAMQVTWRDGCPSRTTRWLDGWFRYRKRQFIADQWQASALSTHMWDAVRWCAMVGCSGLLIVAGQWLLQRKPKTTESEPQRVEDPKFYAAAAALQGEMVAVRQQLELLRKELTQAQATPVPKTQAAVPPAGASQRKAHRSH